MLILLVLNRMKQKFNIQFMNKKTRGLEKRHKFSRIK